MQRDIIVNGWLFGIDPDKPTRVRFAHPFHTADKYNFIDPMCGAITGLFDADGELGIECGSTIFYLSGNSAYNFQLRQRVGPEA